MQTMIIGDREIHLKFPARTIMTMEDTANEVLFGSKGYMSIEVLLNHIDRMNVLLYLFKKGLDWKGSGAKAAEAEDLFDKYMESDELDTGERFKDFQMEVACALAASRGIDLKKTIAKAQESQIKTQEVSSGIGN